MANRRCPSCGQSYNGKRCGSCFYEPFGEVRTSYEFHKTPEPDRRTDAPLRRNTMPRTRPRRRSQGNPFKRIAVIWSVLVVLIMMVSLVSTMISMMERTGSSFVSVKAEPEPVPLPAEGILVYEDADILVLADWDGSSPMTQDIPIYVQNFTSKELTVCTDGVAVNGCMTEDVFFYCEAYPNSVCRAALWVDMETLGEMGIKEGQYIQMSIDVMDEDYNSLVENAPATLGGEYVQELSNSGTVLYDQDGFCLVYQGMDEDPFGDPRLIFYGENNTAHFMELSGNELLIDGEETGCWLWQNFLPGTKGIFYGRIHDFKIPQDNALAEVELFLTPDGDWEQEIYLGTIEIPLN